MRFLHCVEQAILASFKPAFLHRGNREVLGASLSPKAGSPICLKELYAVIKELTHDYDIRNSSEYTFIFCSFFF